MIPTWLIILAGLFVLGVLLQTLVGMWMEGATKRDIEEIRRIRETAQKNIDTVAKAAVDEAKTTKNRRDT